MKREKFENTANGEFVIAVWHNERGGPESPRTDNYSNHEKKQLRINVLKILTGCLSALLLNGCSFFFLLNFSGGIGTLKNYPFEGHTKKELNAAIKHFYKDYPQYYPPPETNPNSLIHYYLSLSTPESRSINADSVMFHFYLKIKDDEEILYWTELGHHNWDTTQDEYGIACILCLRGIRVKGSGWKTQGDYNLFTIMKKKHHLKLFEAEILPKIQEYLKEG